MSGTRDKIYSTELELGYPGSCGASKSARMLYFARETSFALCCFFAAPCAVHSDDFDAPIGYALGLRFKPRKL